jgi:hypothetical protein
MSLFLATLLPGLFLVLLGGLLLWGGPRVVTTAKALPRSEPAAWVFFGAGATWFIWRVSSLNESDFIVASSPTPLMVGFAVVAVLAFFCTPDFLAVRGLCVLMLMAADPLLRAAYMEWDHPQRLLMVTAVYLGLAAAIYLGASPFRLRDFFDWLFGRPTRAKWFGAALLTYGAVTSAAAFTY